MTATLAPCKSTKSTFWFGPRDNAQNSIEADVNVDADHFGMIENLENIYDDLIAKAEAVKRFALNSNDPRAAKAFVAIATEGVDGVAIPCEYESFQAADMVKVAREYNSGVCGCCDEYKPGELNEDGECADCSTQLTYHQECRQAAPSLYELSPL